MNGDMQYKRRRVIQHNDNQHNDTKKMGLFATLSIMAAECHYAEFSWYAECRYVVCRYAECRGAV
jgi:hypothetical protein